MPPLTLMLKPASSLCNLRCRYCFYADESARRSVASYGLMQPETLRAVLEKALAHAEGHCTIAFQGGEPTLAGLDFFKEAVRLEQELNQNGCRIENALQTNGCTLTDEWAAFLAQEKFLVGVSLDGPKELHDANRVDEAGNGTFARVMHGIDLLKKHGVEFNILTVVTAQTCRATRRVYNFFAKSSLAYQQYIPCLDPLGEVRGGHPWSLTPKAYAQQLLTSFACWYEDAMRGQKRYHNYFDNLLLLLNGQLPASCGMNGVCSYQYVVEADGSVYPCDFYMLDERRLGNLCTDTFAELDARRAELGFLAESAIPHPDCVACEWRALCRGGCRRDRDYFTDSLGKNYYCEAYRTFFAAAYPRLQEVYRLVTGPHQF